MFAQNIKLTTDTSKNEIYNFLKDSLQTKSDSSSRSSIVHHDTIKKNRKSIISKQAITTKIKYSALDSIEIDVSKKSMQLHEQSKINYNDINVEANYIEINFNTKKMFAKGTPDSTGKITGKPVFTEKEKSFKSDNMTYNFNTKKGLITKIISQEGEGYLHGLTVKKMQDDVINIKHGSYTTCDKDEPHFELKFLKAKVIPNKKIICGPAYMTIENVPTPFVIPFGFFPIHKGRASGLILPAPGESSRQGFYLKNAGYYFGINDYIDMELHGDIYTNLSWAGNSTIRYRKRYKYNGSFNFSYTLNNWGEKGLPDFTSSRDFKINWNHTQDAKADPNSTFTASVNAGSSKYNMFNTTNTSDRLSNSMQSCISYSKNWSNQYMFSANMRHSQNTLDRQVNLTLPELTFSVNRFYPLRKKKTTGKLHWYENISVNYVMNARNEINVADSNLFKPTVFDSMRNGINHTIPIQSTIKILKYFNLTNSINYDERWYFQSVEKHWDTLKKGPVDSVIHRFGAARDYNFSSSLTTKLYGMMRFNKTFPVNAIRWVISPNVGFSYRPDFSDPQYNIYKTYTNDKGEKILYSIYEQGMYGSPAAGKSGSLNFSISNNLEMKVKSKKDTVTGTKKIPLIENLTISGSYNLANVPYKWSKISLTGRTRLFNNINLNYNALFDPYVVDYNNVNVPEFEITQNKRILRLINDGWATSLSWSLPYSKNKNSTEKPNEKNEKIEKKEKKNTNKISWHLTIDYSLGYSTVYAPYYIWPYYRETPSEFGGQNKKSFLQTLSVNGSLDLTAQWKINFGTGYDFNNKQLSYSHIEISRDLHCWQMNFTCVPIGIYRSYTFTLRAKSSLLQDLKLEKRKNSNDNF